MVVIEKLSKSELRNLIFWLKINGLDTSVKTDFFVAEFFSLENVEDITNSITYNLHTKIDEHVVELFKPVAEKIIRYALNKFDFGEYPGQMCYLELDLFPDKVIVSVYVEFFATELELFEYDLSEYPEVQNFINKYNVDQISISYSGGGDDGVIDAMEVTKNDDIENEDYHNDYDKVNKLLLENIQCFSYIDFNNEGCSGTVQISDGQMIIEHYYHSYYVSCVCEFELKPNRKKYRYD